MGGQIKVESKPSKGSVFMANIPLPIGKIEDIETQSAANYDISEISAMKMNILAADDNAANRHILGKFIEIIGADLELVEAVSYTHLDVYKRQNIIPPRR